MTYSRKPNGSGTGGALDAEIAKDGWQHPSSPLDRLEAVKEGTYAAVRIVASSETANFPVLKRNTAVRACGLVIHAAHFHIYVSAWALSGASTRQNFGGAPLFFSSASEQCHSNK